MVLGSDELNSVASTPHLAGDIEWCFRIAAELAIVRSSNSWFIFSLSSPLAFSQEEAS
jgi:hypothetical protein